MHLARLRLKFVTCTLLYAAFFSLPLTAESQVRPSTSAFGSMVDSCVQMTARLITGKRTSVNYWKERLGRDLVAGEILMSQKFGANNFVFRFDGQSVRWEYYRITGRSYQITAAYYPLDYFSLDFFRGKSLLDVGAGKGVFVESLRDRMAKAGYQGEIQGVDLKLNEKTEGKSYFHEADIANTPFKSNSFDVVVSTWSIFSYEAGSDPVFISKALREVTRITKPGGYILMAPVEVEKIADYTAEIPELSVVQSGWQRSIFPDPATILTLGRYIVLQKQNSVLH